jgi:hypothetical protein
MEYFIYFLGLFVMICSIEKGNNWMIFGSLLIIASQLFIGK